MEEMDHGVPIYSSVSDLYRLSVWFLCCQKGFMTGDALSLFLFTILAYAFSF